MHRRSDSYLFVDIVLYFSIVLLMTLLGTDRMHSATWRTSPASRSMSSLRRLVLAVLALVVPAAAFEWQAAGHRPEVTRRAIAGLWKLTPALRHPLKEFTVYPKKTATEDAEPELLFMLKEDGSFQQYDDSDGTEERDESLEDSWKRFRENQDEHKAEETPLAKGIWDYRDGKLILAADRPLETQKPELVKYQDTLLEGLVVATYETSLPENPVLEVGINDRPVNATATQGNTEKRWDAHLAVPKGSVKVGKFFYPKSHPSFFETPIFNPAKRGGFQLRQVLGSLNTNLPEESDYVEKFQRADFYNKTFLLTSHPIGLRRPKGNSRWSIKYNKFVEEIPSKKAKKFAEDIANHPVNIRAMQVRFFQNDTFATLCGTGDAILRGQFDIFGEFKDHLWMQISIFGFGRSVSGSVYSEGRMLNTDDAKSYWGSIKYASDEEPGEDGVGNDAETTPRLSQDADDGETKKLEIKGSVLFGTGLEPLPVGRFIMRETDDIFGEALDDEEDDEEDDRLPDFTASMSDIAEEDGVDWSNEDAFQ